MQSTSPNSLFSRIWSFLTGKTRKQSSLTGSQRPLARLAPAVRRNYDLEIDEYPIREPALARELIEMDDYCWEVKHCLSYAARDVFASSDGDDIGWTIADTLDDNETKIDPDVKVILLDLIQRRNSSGFVLGGGFLKRAIRRSLGYGDCFIELGIEKEGIGRRDYGIARTLYLPTWEMFRCESDQGQLLRFEQRRRLAEHDPDHQFHPLSVVHFRHEQKFLYGQSLFGQSAAQQWGRLKDATFDLAQAARAVGVNPNLHTFPEGFSRDQQVAYKADFEQLQADGIITDLFLQSGQDVRKMANGDPKLEGLIDYVLKIRYGLIPPGFPVWMFPGLETTGAREISGQPAFAYARMRNDWCSMLSDGIRKFLDIELILKLGFDEFQRRGQYRIVFPKWSVDAKEIDTETDRAGVHDLDED